MEKTQSRKWSTIQESPSPRSFDFGSGASFEIPEGRYLSEFPSHRKQSVFERKASVVERKTSVVALMAKHRRINRSIDISDVDIRADKFAKDFAAVYLDESRSRVVVDLDESRDLERVLKQREAKHRKIQMKQDWLQRQWVGLNGTAPLEQIMRLKETLANARHRVHACRKLQQSIVIEERTAMCKEMKNVTAAMLNQHMLKQTTIRESQREKVAESLRHRTQLQLDTTQQEGHSNLAQSIRQQRKEWSQQRVSARVTARLSCRQKVLQIQADKRDTLFLRPSSFLPPMLSTKGAKTQDMDVGCDAMEADEYDDCTFELPVQEVKPPPLTKITHPPRPSTPVVLPPIATPAAQVLDHQTELQLIRSRVDQAISWGSEGDHAPALVVLREQERLILVLGVCHPTTCGLLAEVLQHSAVCGSVLRDIPLATSYVTREIALLRAHHDNHAPLADTSEGKQLLVGALHVHSLVQLWGATPEHAVATHQQALQLARSILSPDMATIIEDFKNCLAQNW